MEDLHSLWRKQKEFLDSVRNQNPDSFFREPLIDTTATLRRVGIEIFADARPTVYLRLWPQDFIVEEISTGGQPYTIDYKNDRPTQHEVGNTVYADLVKVGISTFDAVEELSRELAIDKKQIGYAGIKDRDAVTSQQLSFRNVPIEKIESASSPSFFLKNIYQSKGVLQIGDLSGNRFTLVIRGQIGFDSQYLDSHLTQYVSEGFWNFFYTQRFGTPRLISHYLGLLVLKRQYEEVFKVLLIYQSPAEVPYYRELRSEIKSHWGKWAKIISILEPLSYSFRRELEMLYYLSKNPKDFLGALKIFTDQVQLWVFAYGSYLFNKKLSFFILSDKAVPAELPLILSQNPADWRLYQDLLNADELKLPSDAIRDFPTIRLKIRYINTRQKFDFHNLVILQSLPKILVMSFTLPKGSYATTLLAHLFTLAGNLPVLENISSDQVDSKEILGTGTITPVLEIFKDVINSKLEMGEGAGEEASG